MKVLDTGKEKVKQICDVLRRETLEPAQMEAEGIVAAAHKEASELLAKAQDRVEAMLEKARQEIHLQRSVFEASLAQSCRQTLDTLKEKIEKKLFSPAMGSLLKKPMGEPKVIGELLSCVVRAIDREGLQAKLLASIGEGVSKEAVNELLAKEVVSRLEGGSVRVSDVGGGVEVKIVGENLTIDLTEEAVKELLAAYIRKDFRGYVFGV